MTDQITFVHQLNTFLAPLLGEEGWYMLEIIGGIFLTITCIMQRIRVDIYRNDRDIMPWIPKKILQAGLFLQMMLGIIASIDGYYSSQEHVTHILFTMAIVASIMVKSGVYLNISSKNVEGELT